MAYLNLCGDFMNVPDPVATRLPVPSSKILDEATCKLLPAFSIFPCAIKGTPGSTGRTKYVVNDVVKTKFSSS